MSTNSSEGAEFELLLDYIDKRAAKEGLSEKKKQQRAEAFLRENGGFTKVSAQQFQDKWNILFNGDFEKNVPFDVDPMGWIFEDSFGVVLDYAAQETDPESNYVPGAFHAAPVISDTCGCVVDDFKYITNPTDRVTENLRLVYADWSARADVATPPITESTTLPTTGYGGSYRYFTYEDYKAFNEDEGLVSESNGVFKAETVNNDFSKSRFLMVQDSQKTQVTTKVRGLQYPIGSYTDTYGYSANGRTRVSSFVFGQHIPRGVLRSGQKYYLQFSTQAWDGFAEEVTIRPNCIVSNLTTRTPYNPVRWSHNCIGLQHWKTHVGTSAATGYVMSERYTGFHTEDSESGVGKPLHTLLWNTSQWANTADVTPFIEILDEDFNVASILTGDSVNTALGGGWVTQTYAFVVPDDVDSANLKFLCRTDSPDLDGIDYAAPDFRIAQGCSVLFDQIGVYPDIPISKAGTHITKAFTYTTRTFAGYGDTIDTPAFHPDRALYLRGVKITNIVNDVTKPITADFAIKINNKYVYYPVIWDCDWAYGTGRTSHASYHTSQGIRYHYCFNTPGTLDTSGSWSLARFYPPQLHGLKGYILGECYVTPGDLISIECATSAPLQLTFAIDFTYC
jgi:hypothetical protein